MSKTLLEIFEGEEKLLETLHRFCNIPDVEVRNDLILAFCEHEQTQHIWKRNKLKPKYFYYMLINQL